MHGILRTGSVPSVNRLITPGKIFSEDCIKQARGAEGHETGQLRWIQSAGALSRLVTMRTSSFSNTLL